MAQRNDREDHDPGDEDDVSDLRSFERGVAIRFEPACMPWDYAFPLFRAPTPEQFETARHVLEAANRSMRALILDADPLPPSTYNVSYDRRRLRAQ